MTDEAQFGRFLTDYEIDAWDEYYRVLKTIPNWKMYDRPSLHDFHPELKAAFLKVQAARTFYRLKN
jgi:hypothetical protein